MTTTTDTVTDCPSCGRPMKTSDGRVRCYHCRPGGLKGQAMRHTDTTVNVSVVCTCRHDGRACPAAGLFTGTDRIDALTVARVAGWGIRDDGAARCPACKAARVPFAAAVADLTRGES